MKKSTFDTTEMEIKELKKQLDDLKVTHQKESDYLRDNAVEWNLDKINNQKKIIESIRKQKKNVLKKIELLQPKLFN